jgi:hypothetical protein
MVEMAERLEKNNWRTLKRNPINNRAFVDNVHTPHAHLNIG